MLKRDKTKQQILEAALSLFIDKGVQNCSVDEIVKSSGIAKGTFFYHFAQKDMIVCEIINQEFDGYFQIPESIVSNKNICAEIKMEKVLISIFSAFKIPTTLEQIFRFGITPQFDKHINNLRLSKIVPLINMVIHQGNQERTFDVEHVEIIASIITKGIIEHVHTEYSVFKEKEEHFHSFLSGIEELINSALKTSKKINILKNI